MNNKVQSFNKIYIIIAVVTFAVLLIGAAVFYIGDSISTKRDNASKAADYTEIKEWTLIDSHGISEATLPLVTDVSQGEVILHSTLPETLKGYDTLDFYNSIDADLYINGELRHSFTRDDKFYGVYKVYHTYIALSDKDAGGSIDIVAKGIDSDKVTVRRVFIGTGFSLFERILDLNLMFFIFSVSLVIIASIAVAVGLIIKLLGKVGTPILAAGVATLLVSLWLVFNSELYQFVYHNYHISGIMSNMMQALLPFPVIAYINGLQKSKYIRPYVYSTLIYEAMLVILVVLHANNLYGYRVENIYIAVGEVLAFGCCIIGLIIDVVKKEFKTYILSLIGTAVFIIFAIIELIMYITIEERHVGTGLMVGTYIWITCAILEQLLAFRKAKEAERQALSASEAKSNFLANMSHEIRTPMNAILGMDEMIIRENSDNEVITKYALDIKSAGNVLLSIINDILDLSKIESGKAEIIRSDFQLGSVINDISNITKSRATDKGLSYYINVDEAMPRGLVGDEIRIRQIMLNVIGNAIKYTNEGWVNVDIAYDRSSEDDNTGIFTVSVTDTGIGIREEDRVKLFESFSRLEVTRNRNIEGTGLGLTITLNYLNMMDGTIDVTSEYGKGSTFTIKIPLNTWDDNPIGDYKKQLYADEVKRDIPYVMAPDAKILVVDDNEMNLDVVNGLLKPTKIMVDNALSGGEAIELTKRKKYDMILLDQMMPNLDGTTTMLKMREKGVDVPIIVLTADAIAKDDYINKGFDGFIAKPVEGDKLEQVIAEYLPGELKLTDEEIKNAMANNKAASDDADHTLKKALVIDKDPKVLKELMQQFDGVYDATFLKDMDMALKYLSKHEVDYIIFKDIKLVKS